jgi:tetratricopeptide (TPR) repeat protein
MLARFGDDPDAWFLAFQFGAGTGDYRQAAVALTVVGYLRPLTRHERVQLGDLYSVIEAPLVATEYYAPAMADSASAGEVERLASAYIASYNNSAALEVLTRSVREKPTARLWSLLGDLHFMQAQYEDAHRAFEASAALDPEDGRPYLMMGYCALEVGNGEDAVASLELASQFEPQAERAQSLLERARVRLAASDPQTGD